MTRHSSKRKSSKRRSSKKPAPIRPNYTAPKRGFVFEGDDEGEGEGESLKSQIRREMTEKLAAEWNTLNSRREERSFRSPEERDAEAEYLADRAVDYADAKLNEWADRTGTDISDLGSNERTWPTEIRKMIQEFENEFYKTLKDEDENTNLRMQVIEELIGELGGRMMRPYEHWNEEEQYREYAERDRDDERDDY